MPRLALKIKEEIIADFSQSYFSSSWQSVSCSDSMRIILRSFFPVGNLLCWDAFVWTITASWNQYFY